VWGGNTTFILEMAPPNYTQGGKTPLLLVLEDPTGGEKYPKGGGEQTSRKESPSGFSL